MGRKGTRRLNLTSQMLLEEAKLILENYPDHEKILDSRNGEELLTKAEALNLFNGDDGFAALFAAKYIGGLELDQHLRKSKK